MKKPTVIYDREGNKQKNPVLDALEQQDRDIYENIMAMVHYLGPIKQERVVSMVNKRMQWLPVSRGGWVEYAISRLIEEDGLASVGGTLVPGSRDVCRHFGHKRVDVAAWLLDQS